jgi:hypothetical protein
MVEVVAEPEPVTPVADALMEKRLTEGASGT